MWWMFSSKTVVRREAVITLKRLRIRNRRGGLRVKNIYYALDDQP